MADYQYLGDNSGAFAVRAEFFRCSACGAVVAERQEHDAWHDAVAALTSGPQVVSREELRRRAAAVREQMGDSPMAAYLNADDVSGVARIAAERVRQVQEEGWSQEHDDQWTDGQLIEGALAYAGEALDPGGLSTRQWWPDEFFGFKPSDDPVRNLEKAGAMIAAEIDRLVRARESDR